MIRFTDLNINSEKTLEDQVEELSNGTYYLKNAKKFENKRNYIKSEFYSGRLSIQDYSKLARNLINEVLSNIEKEEYFGSTDKLPF